MMKIRAPLQEKEEACLEVKLGENKHENNVNGSL